MSNFSVEHCAELSVTCVCVRAQLCRARSMQLWALFPSVCVAPVDVGTAFNPQLGQLLTKAMMDARYGDVTGYA